MSGAATATPTTVLGWQSIVNNTPTLELKNKNDILFQVSFSNTSYAVNNAVRVNSQCDLHMCISSMETIMPTLRTIRNACVINL